MFERQMTVLAVPGAERKLKKISLRPTHGTKADASAIPPKLTFTRPLAYAYHHTRPDG